MTAARVALTCALVVCVASCRKKHDAEPAGAPHDSATAAQPEPPGPPLPPLPPATPGAMYASLANGGVARYDADGWRFLPLPETGWVRLSLGVDGTLWAYNNDGVWRFDGTAFAAAKPAGAIKEVAGASDGSLWAIVDGSLRHLTGDTWTTEVVPGGDPPRGVAAANEGIWVRTLDRTYRRSEGKWLSIDVPGVTGAMVDILSLATDGREGAYLLTSTGVMAYQARTWKAIWAPTMANDTRARVIAGPKGRFAVDVGAVERVADQRFLGDTARGLRALEVHSPDGKPLEVALLAVDDTGRTWAAFDANLIVLGPDGKVLKRWQLEDAPLLSSNIISIVVAGGGPAHLASGERARGTVTGKVEGSAVGMTVVTCTAAWNYAGTPCEGVATARTATTTTGGRFKLDGVTVGPTSFWVQRNGRWRVTTGTACCTQLVPDGTLDIGTLTLQ